MIDTHSHLNFRAFESDWREVIERAQFAGVSKIIMVGTDIDSSVKAVEMAQQSSVLYAAVGIHPHHAKKYQEFRGESLEFSKYTKKNNEIDADLKTLEHLIQQPKVVAVGEIGLDYHIYSMSKYQKSPLRQDLDGQANIKIEEEIRPELIVIQKQLFQEQLTLAQKHNKPVIVHSRKAKEEVLNALVAFNQTSEMPIKGVFHCFEGGKKMAKRVIEAGFLVSFTGNITYDHGRAEVSKTIPLDSIMLETDCPYMTPTPERVVGEVLRSEPRHVKIIGQYHAKLRGISEDEVFRQTTLNAENLFGI
jgi:TatD DNase family protein